MATITIPENIKKTSTLTYSVISTLLSDELIDQSIFDKISKTLEKAVKGINSNGEKVLHFLYNEDNEIIGRYCNVTHLWFPLDRFMAKSGRVKEMDLLMKKEYMRVGKIKKEAEELFISLTQAQPEDKLELLTKYEELKEAGQPQLPTSEEIGSVEGGHVTVDDLASELGVVVILEKSED